MLLTFANITFSQVNNENTVTNGVNSSAIGKSTKATGVASFASGAYSISEGLASTSIGFRNLSSGIYTTTLGNFLKATVSHAMVIGDGYGLNNELVNNNGYSLMIGFNSTKPTIFVGTSPGYQQTGKVGIGNVTSPLQKLHLRADEDEIAAMLIEPYNWAGGSGGSGGSNGGSISDIKAEGSLYENGAYLFLGNSNHGIGAVSDLGLLFNSESNYIFGEGRVGINTAQPRHTLHVNGSIFTNEFILYDAHNIPRSGYVLVSDDEGKGYWVDPLANGVGLWKVNEDDANDIYYNSGNVGIGTIETYDYRLAVNGKILTDEVMVKHYDTWPDYVFEPEYKLMPLKEVEAFVKMNKHLPNVKSQAEVEDGYGLSEMNTVLLQKIEELTLYVIKQEKEMKSQMELIEAQQEMIKTQQEDIKKIKEQLTEK